MANRHLCCHYFYKCFMTLSVCRPPLSSLTQCELISESYCKQNSKWDGVWMILNQDTPLHAEAGSAQLGTKTKRRSEDYTQRECMALGVIGITFLPGMQCAIITERKRKKNLLSSNDEFVHLLRGGLFYHCHCALPVLQSWLVSLYNYRAFTLFSGQICELQEAGFLGVFCLSASLPL